MKYLNKFESMDNDLIQFGLEADDIKWYFTDIVDDGFSIKINTNAKLFDFGMFKNQQKLGLVNYIEVILMKDSENSDYLKSDEFKNTIEVAELRLLENGLFIKEVNKGTIGTILRIQILIYKKIDEKYIK